MALISVSFITWNDVNPRHAHRPCVQGLRRCSAELGISWLYLGAVELSSAEPWFVPFSKREGSGRKFEQSFNTELSGFLENVWDKRARSVKNSAQHCQELSAGRRGGGGLAVIPQITAAGLNVQIYWEVILVQSVLPVTVFNPVQVNNKLFLHLKNSHLDI